MSAEKLNNIEPTYKRIGKFKTALILAVTAGIPIGAELYSEYRASEPPLRQGIVYGKQHIPEHTESVWMGYYSSYNRVPEQNVLKLGYCPEENSGSICRTGSIVVDKKMFNKTELGKYVDFETPIKK